MKNFNILLHKELKENLFSRGKGEKRDILSLVFTILLILIIVFGLVFIALTISKAYVGLSFEGIRDKYIRSGELLNFLYLFFSILMLIYVLEKERRIMVNTNDRPILLRLPVKSSTIFLSKFIVVYILSLMASFCIIVPLNIIFYVSIGEFNYLFIIGTLFNVLTYPILPLFLATILLIPYIKIVNFFKNKQLLTLIFYVLLLAGGFILYSMLLDVFRTLLENGNLKFLFNDDNIAILNNLYKFSFPINWYVNISLGTNKLISYIGLFSLFAVAFIISYFLAKVMFYHTLYTNIPTKDRVYKPKCTAYSPFVSMLRKEFILTYRDNNNLFSYFAIALAMPLMVYASFTLFRSLLLNAIGLKLDFILGILLLFVFIVLTNTYSASNISREGNAFLKSKAFPYSAKKIFLAKVIFDFIVSSIVTLVSCYLIIRFSEINVGESLVLVVCGILFSVSQILYGTKMDLNKANLTLNNYEIGQKQEKTITKLVFNGLVFSLVLGVCLIFIKVLLPTKVDINLVNILIICLPILFTLIYFGIGVVFYLYKLEKKFVNLVL